MITGLYTKHTFLHPKIKNIKIMIPRSCLVLSLEARGYSRFFFRSDLAIKDTSSFLSFTIGSFPKIKLKNYIIVSTSRIANHTFKPGGQSWPSHKIPWEWQHVSVDVVKKHGAWNRFSYILTFRRPLTRQCRNVCNK